MKKIPFIYTPPLNPEVYFLAAERIESEANKGCCGAINNAGVILGLDLEEREMYDEAFSKVFKPKGKTAHQFWWDEPTGLSYHFSHERKAREAALILMGCMVRDGVIK